MNSLGYLDSILSEGPANGNFQVCLFLEATVKASAVTLTNRMWFSVFRTLIDNEYVSSQWPKCCGHKRRHSSVKNNERNLCKDSLTIENSNLKVHASSLSELTP